MKMNKFVKNVEPSLVYIEFLRSLNGILKLTEKEIQILAKIIELNPDIVEEDEYANVVSLQVRRKLIKHVSVNKANLSAYIGGFLKKNILLKDKLTGSVRLNKAVIPIITDGVVTIQMIININVK